MRKARKVVTKAAEIVEALPGSVRTLASEVVHAAAERIRLRSVPREAASEAVHVVGEMIAPPQQPKETDPMR